jgi:hypothetical protein
MLARESPHEPQRNPEPTARSRDGAVCEGGAVKARLSDISHETPSKTFFVTKEGKGLYRVLRNGPTAATVCATFHFPNNQAKALGLAVERANQLEEAKFGGV